MKKTLQNRIALPRLSNHGRAFAGTMMRTGVLAIGAALVVPQASAVNLRIIGGVEAQIEQFPYISALVERGMDATDAFCGASVIDARWVMTAAHCLEGFDASTLDVVTGVENLERVNEGQRIAVRRVINHPAYDADAVSNDIALLELERPTNAPRITLATRNDMALFNEGQPVAVAGWGDRTDGGNDFPVQLHAVDLSISNFDSCSQVYDGLSSVHLCAGVPDGSRDSCSGDSGGPLVARTPKAAYQVGIVSFGERCGSASHPGVYTRVSEFSAFISQHVGSSVLAQTSSNNTAAESNSESTLMQVTDTQFNEQASSVVPPITVPANADTFSTDTLADQQAVNSGQDLPINSQLTGAATSLELTQLDQFAYETGDNEVSILVEVFNNSDIEVMLSSPVINADIPAFIDADKCLGAPLQPDDFCDMEVIWNSNDGSLDGRLTLDTFDGISTGEAEVVLQAELLEPADFADALDYDTDYYTDDPYRWDTYGSDALAGDSSLSAAFDEDAPRFLSAEFDNRGGDILEFSYQLKNTNSVISINGEDLYYLAATDEWQTASLELPTDARVDWRFEPAADLTARADSVSSQNSVNLDGFRLISGDRAEQGNTTGATAANTSLTPVADNADSQSPLSGGGGSLHASILVLLLGLIAQRGSGYIRGHRCDGVDHA